MTTLSSREPTTGSEAMRRAIGALRAAAVPDAPLEAELLLRHVLGQDKTCFYLRLPTTLNSEQYGTFLELLAQRLAHRPTAYITGFREFFNLELHVAPGVLIPRSETEGVVERCIAGARRLIAQGRLVSLVDVGTGSGAIALAFAKHVPQANVLAVDRSPEALAVAAYNAKRLRLAGRVRFRQSDLLGGIAGPFDLVAANLPYVPSTVVDALAPEVRDFEPRVALDGGLQGLDLIRRLLDQLPARVAPGGIAVLEIGSDQGDALRTLAPAWAGVPAEVEHDLAGRERYAVLQF